MCGPVGDFQKQIDYLGDFRVLFDYYFPNIMPPLVGPLNGFPYQSQEYRAKIQAAAAATRELIALLT